MKSLKLILVICVSFIASRCSAQISFADTINRSESQNFIKKYFDDSLVSKNFILFSAGGTQYLIIIESRKLYEIYYFNVDSSYKFKYKKIKFTKKKPNKILAMAFNEKRYRQDLITMNSDFFKGKHPFFSGTRSYFFLSKKGRKFGEESLPLFANPNPIDKPVYRYLLLILFKYSK